MGKSLRLIISGFVLLVLGWIFPFLMVIRILAPSWGLGFFSFGASVLGLLLGVAGALQYARIRRGPPIYDQRLVCVLRRG